MKCHLTISSLFLTSALSTPISAATLDQSQPINSGGISISAAGSVAQTFTAGFNQVLNKIEVDIDTWASAPTYPVTVTLRETISGAPTGIDLTSIFYANGFGNLGWFSIDFSQKNIALTEGQMYALVFSNDDSVILDNSTDGVAVSWNPMSYSGGALWQTYGGNGWDISYEGDIAFQTYGTPTVPLPAAFWLFGSALFGVIGLQRKY